MKNDTTDPVLAETVVSAHVLMYDASGPRGLYGGVCPLLGQALAQAAKMEGSGVTRRDNVFEPLGQDIYDVTYAALMRLSGLFSFLTYQELDDLVDTWPSGLLYSVIVTR